ncbi:hypothetical protein EUX98_g1149 [Antrodiella citrinella]|uniref:Uncharacterized protein n=1 Tax=Antrodiella citrinella TaxID=2447956 RepID=A0A4S4N592_9APHY|nr:hypothetical protein EUX98_g1149 [Antrodiella citrinella]
MDATALRTLGRKDLQELAKRDKIRANAKSEQIIQELVAKHPQGVPGIERKKVIKTFTIKREETRETLHSRSAHGSNSNGQEGGRGELVEQTGGGSPGTVLAWAATVPTGSEPEAEGTGAQQQESNGAAQQVTPTVRHEEEQVHGEASTGPSQAGPSSYPEWPLHGPGAGPSSTLAPAHASNQQYGDRVPTFSARQTSPLPRTRPTGGAIRVPRAEVQRIMKQMKGYLATGAPMAAKVSELFVLKKGIEQRQDRFTAEFDELQRMRLAGEVYLAACKGTKMLYNQKARAQAAQNEDYQPEQEVQGQNAPEDLPIQNDEAEQVAGLDSDDAGEDLFKNVEGVEDDEDQLEYEDEEVEEEGRPGLVFGGAGEVGHDYSDYPQRLQYPPSDAGSSPRAAEYKAPVASGSMLGKRSRITDEDYDEELEEDEDEEESPIRPRTRARY